MLIRRRRANLIDMYWSTLRHQRIPEPPAGLDEETAALIAQLDRHLAAPDASDAFVERAWRRLEATPETTDTRRAWSGPAIDPAQQRRTARAVKESEERVMSNLTQTPAPIEPVVIAEHRRSREALKVAAALIIFAVVGAVLILVLRDNDDEPSVAVPGPTSTVVSSPAASTATRAFSLTPTANALDLTVTAVWGRATAEAATAPGPDWSGLGATGISIPIGGTSWFVAAGSGAIWVSWIDDGGSGHVSRIDPATNTVVATIDNAGGETLEVTPNAIWAASATDDRIDRIDPATNQVVASIQAPEAFHLFVGAISATASDVWVTDISTNGQVLRYDAATGALITSVKVGAPRDVLATDSAVWVVGGSEQQTFLTKIDPATNAAGEPAAIGSGGSPTIEMFDSDLWVSQSNEGALTRIDPDSGAVVSTIQVNRPGSDVAVTISDFAFDEAGLWVLDGGVRAVFLFDAGNGDGLGSAAIDSDAITFALANGSLWVPDQAHGAVSRVTRSQ